VPITWVIADRVACQIWTFSGVSFGGEKRIGHVLPGGRWQGDALEPKDVLSMGVVGSVGIRVVLRASRLSEGWEEQAWRCIRIMEGQTLEMQDGKTAIQVPDLDRLQAPTAARVHDPLVTVPFAKDLASGEGWTFGNPCAPLRGRVRAIYVDRI
jgi:hypothetical protein